MQITALARDMGITRGSFYWHFKNRDDLLGAIVDEWRLRNTGVMLRALQDAHDLDRGLLSLFTVWIDHRHFDPALDQAMRMWAHTSAEIKTHVDSEDNARIQAITAFLHRFGFDHPEALIRARVIYLTQISFDMLGFGDTAENRPGYLPAYFKCFIGRAPDPAAADEYLKRYDAMLDKKAP